MIDEPYQHELEFIRNLRLPCIRVYSWIGSRIEIGHGAPRLERISALLERIPGPNNEAKLYDDAGGETVQAELHERNYLL